MSNKSASTTKGESNHSTLTTLSQERATKSNAIEIPQVTLPKGGGALKGIDEKFQVNAANGTASLSIPLPLSPNRNGFTPQLSLSYNSGTGNGLFGIGWDIDLPSIQRRTDKKIPRYFDTNEVNAIPQEDSFMFSGVEELVPFLELKNDKWEVKQEENIEFIIRNYRPRIEGSFSRIERIYLKNTKSFYWKVTSKENITTFFGISEKSRIADPTDTSKVFQWLPEFSYDDKGSWIWYEYKIEEKENIVNEIHEKNRKEEISKIANRHIKRIKYGNKTAKYFENAPYFPELPVNDPYFFELVFDYGEHGNVGETITYLEKTIWNARADAFSSYRSGFEVRNYRLCRRVLLFHHFTELGNTPTLVRSINFEYGFSNIYENLKTKLKSNNSELTYLLAIEQTGYVRTDKTLEVYTQKSLPKMTFEYQKLNWDKKVKNISNENLVHAPVGLSGNYQWTDLYNEGINGILTEQANAWYYKSNLGQAQVHNDELGELNFTHAQPVMPKPSFLGFGNGVLQLRDLDANGQKQIVVNTDGIHGYFELGDEGEWKPFKTFLKNLNLDLKNPNVRMLDVDGDGKPEIVFSDQGAFWWWKNEGKVGYDAPELAIKPYDEERGAAILFSDQAQRIFLADMSGDGLTDIVRIRNGEVCYWTNMGYGRFGAKVTMTNSPLFDNPDLFNPSYIQLADISGTGATDIIYLGKNKFKAYLNCSGNAWSNPEEIEPFFPTEQPNKITITDLLGNGTACIVWSSELPAYQNAPMRYIDLMGGHKPHIMTSHENGMGKKTEVVYKSSTYFYLKDKIGGTPWATKLPFPVQVVAKSIVTESVTNVRFTSQYTYHHGYYDHPEREFRGFGRVEQIDTEDFDVFNVASNNPAQEHHQPPVSTKTWFHTGAFLTKERILSQFKHEYWYNKNKLQNVEHELPDAILLAAENLNGFSINQLGADEWREALRACKGMTLRQEVFGKDGSERESLPYNVVTHNCEIQLLQHRGQNRFATFIVKESEAITYTYERNPIDPRIAHTLNLSTDEYGNVLESVSVVYPRLQEENILQVSTDLNNLDTSIITATKAKGVNGQKKMWITYSKNDFTTKNDKPQDIITPTNYYLRKGWQTQTFELTGILPTNSIFSLTDFKGKINDFQPLDYEKKATIGKQKRLIEHIKTKFYNEELSAPLPDGEMAIRGISFESYQLAYTPNLLKDIFSPSTFSIPFEITEVDMLKGKFIKDNENWWIQSGKVDYYRDSEVQSFVEVKTNFFAPVGYKDPFESKTEVFYDPLHLFMERNLDAHQNETKVLSFNFRTLSPVRMQDVNDNISSVIVDELGLAKATSIEGKGSEADNLTGFTETTTVMEQSTITQFFAEASVQAPNICNYTQLKALAHQLLGNATARMVYDFSKKPCVVASIVREKHKDPDSPLQISFEYTDGLRKVAMKKVQAESGKVTLPDNSKIDTLTELRWVGNGRTVLNNKGNPIKQYEPYFSTTPAYENDPNWVERGVSPILYYDGAGRNIKTDLPNGTFTKVVFDAWKQRNYDVNDTVIDSAWYSERLLLPNDNPEKKAALKAKVHFDTPSIIILDTLGRPTLGIDQNRWEEIINDNPMIKNESYYTFSDIDIEGNALSISDARGNVVMAWRYDMLGHRVTQTSMDAGKRWLLNDGMGKPVRTFDERKHEFIYEYDALHRPIAKRVNGGDKVIHSNSLYEKIEYGDTIGMTLAQREAEKRLNRIGKPKNLYDTAGKITSNQYDFKGNLLESNRTFAIDYKNTPNWDLGIPDSLLETTNYTFTTKTEFDALNRSTQQITPDGKITKPIFNTAGLLEKVILNENGTETEFVKSIDYDEKGQRINIQYGNNVTTKYEYDPLTFRLKNLKTTAAPDGGAILQDLNYCYDPTGNITQIADSAIPDVFFRNSRITATNQYGYDALYRLKEANGRESDSILDISKDNWNDIAFMKPHANGDIMAMRLYTQKYQYDAVGNIMRMIHQAGTGSWQRNNVYETQNNRLKNTEINNNTFEFSYQFPLGSGGDAHGFITKMPHLSLMDWNFKEELQATSKQVVNNGGTPETTYYVYDGGGQRARKITENQATVGATPTKKDERIYIGSYEIYRNENNLERETLHIMDDKSRIAMLDTETEPKLILGIPAGRTTPIKTIRYQLSNHLGSTNLELDENAQTITYEEYHPYGTTAYQAKNANIKAAAKRYRYTGMERDEETGLEYHIARYYLPWLGRWLSVDPIGVGDGVNFFEYCSANPVNKKDLLGKEGLSWLQKKALALDDLINAHPAAKAVVDNLDKRGDALVSGVVHELKQNGEDLGDIAYGVSHLQDSSARTRLAAAVKRQAEAPVRQVVGTVKGFGETLDRAGSALGDVAYYSTEGRNEAGASAKVASGVTDLVLDIPTIVLTVDGAASMAKAAAPGLTSKPVSFGGGKSGLPKPLVPALEPAIVSETTITPAAKATSTAEASGTYRDSSGRLRDSTTKRFVADPSKASGPTAQPKHKTPEYKKAQADLRRESISNPDVDSGIRGWLRQEERQRGSNPRNWRNPPGYHTGHIDPLDNTRLRWETGSQNSSRGAKFKR